MATLTQSATLPQLQEGDTGEAVRFLQQLLIAFNHLDKNEFNAVFRQSTKEAVIAFQRSLFTQNPSQVDGIVGPNTWEALSSNFNSD